MATPQAPGVVSTRAGVVIYQQCGGTAVGVARGRAHFCVNLQALQGNKITKRLQKDAGIVFESLECGPTCPVNFGVLHLHGTVLGGARGSVNP